MKLTKTLLCAATLIFATSPLAVWAESQISGDSKNALVEIMVSIDSSNTHIMKKRGASNTGVIENFYLQANTSKDAANKLHLAGFVISDNTSGNQNAIIAAWEAYLQDVGQRPQLSQYKTQIFYGADQNNLHTTNVVSIRDLLKTSGFNLHKGIWTKNITIDQAKKLQRDYDAGKFSNIHYLDGITGYQINDKFLPLDNQDIMSKLQGNSYITLTIQDFSADPQASME